MNRKVCKLLILSTISFLTIGCNNDIDRFLDNPYWIHAEFNPSYGLPIGHGEVALEDVIDKVGALPEEISITYDNSNIITLNYATVLHNEIAITVTEESNASKRKHGNAAKNDSCSIETFEFSDSIAFDLRSQFGEFIPNNEQLQLHNIYLTLASHITTDASQNTLENIEQWDIEFYLDSAKVYASDTTQGTRFLLAELEEGLILTDIISESGFHDTLFKKHNFGDVLSRNFNKISYSICMHAKIPQQTDITSVSNFIKDSLDISKLILTNDIAVEYPVTGMISNLGYDFNVQMQTGEIDTYGIGIDTAQLVLEIENGIPLELCLQAQFVDSLGQVLFNAFPNSTYDTITAANVVEHPETNSHVSGTPSTSVHYISLNDERFQHLQRTHSLQVSVAASTSRGEDESNNKMVSLRRQDKLKVRAYIQATPRYVFDTIIRF